MRTIITLTCCLFTSLAWAEAPATTTSRVFVVTAAGPVAADWVGRVTDWAARNLAMPVTNVSALADVPGTLDAAADQALAVRKEHWAGVIVLAAPVTASAAHGVLRPEQGVAVINVPAMRSDGAIDDLVLMRLERQVIRGICMLLGLDNCPNPQSAMYAYDSLAGLDAIGRNLDPPWLIKAQRAALDKGIAVDRESPFCLVN